MRLLALCVAVFIGFVLFRALEFERVEPRSNIDVARELYARVNKTLPSVVNARENEKIIRDRLECYAEDNDYARRIRICNNLYAKALVKQARETLTSRPDMGLFVSNIIMCPIMQNMCVGQTGNNMERCVTFERQCVDYMLDSYWRGAAQYTHQQYRSE